LSLSELPCRSRLSQFVILPPFQGKGNGANLYRTIYDYYLHHEQTKELTVEDPNEGFDDLRDLCDLTYLRTVPEFNSLKIDSNVKIPKSGSGLPAPKNIVVGAELEPLRLKVKIAPRQFYRVLEMHLMSQLPDSVRPHLSLEKVAFMPSPSQKHDYALWQLFVKQRLYRHNKDSLGQLERPDRIEKLQETLASVEFEYARLLGMLARWAKHTKTPAEVTNGSAKRKISSDADEAPSKKARVEDA